MKFSLQTKYDFIATPYLDPVAILSKEKMAYNADFVRARNCVEQVIGRLKKRWPPLLKGLRFWDMAKCSKAIEVYVALYNFILKEEGDFDNYDEEVLEDDEDDFEDNPTLHISADKTATNDKILSAYYKDV